MSDLNDYEEELTELIAEVRKGIDGLPKIKSPPEKQSKIVFLKTRVNRLKDVLKSYKIELRELPKSDPSYESSEKKVKDFSDAINQLLKDLDYAQERADLIGDARPQDLDSMTTDQILDKAADKQKQTVTVVDGIINQVNQTRTVATDTMDTLKQQTEQLQKAEDDMNEIDDNLKEATKLIRSFARRTMTDKLILVFICLIACAVLFVIIWSILKKPFNTTTPTDFTPPPAPAPTPAPAPSTTASQ